VQRSKTKNAGLWKKIVCFHGKLYMLRASHEQRGHIKKSWLQRLMTHAHGTPTITTPQTQNTPSSKYKRVNWFSCVQFLIDHDAVKKLEQFLGK
jgi:hypothetical protein